MFNCRYPYIRPTVIIIVTSQGTCISTVEASKHYQHQPGYLHEYCRSKQSERIQRSFMLLSFATPALNCGWCAPTASHHVSDTELRVINNALSRHRRQLIASQRTGLLLLTSTNHTAVTWRWADCTDPPLYEGQDCEISFFRSHHADYLTIKV